MKVMFHKGIQGHLVGKSRNLSGVTSGLFFLGTPSVILRIMSDLLNSVNYTRLQTVFFENHYVTLSTLRIITLSTSAFIKMYIVK